MEDWSQYRAKWRDSDMNEVVDLDNLNHGGDMVNGSLHLQYILVKYSLKNNRTNSAFLTDPSPRSTEGMTSSAGAMETNRSVGRWIVFPL
jgi:hypothetical protein